MNNSVNLKLIEGGYRIKRGDKASLFRFLLLDERKEKITTIEGVKATVILKKDDEHIYKTTSKVVDGTVDFTIKELLEQGEYILEIHAGGYVFPSSNSVRISVVKSLVDIEDEPQMSFEEKMARVSHEVKSTLENLSYSLYTFKKELRSEALFSFISNYSDSYPLEEDEIDFIMDVVKKLWGLEKSPKPLSISMRYSDDESGDFILSASRADADANEINWEIFSENPGEEVAEILGESKGIEIRVRKKQFESDTEDEEAPDRSATIRATYLDEVSEITI